MGLLKREPISRQTKNPFKNQLQDRNLVIMGKFVKWHAAKAKKIRSAVSVLKCVGARGATFQWEISWGSFLDKMQNSSIEKRPQMLQMLKLIWKRKSNGKSTIWDWQKKIGSTKRRQIFIYVAGGLFPRYKNWRFDHLENWEIIINLKIATTRAHVVGQC